ncbi:BQ5605_C005g03678 [Microbotryum silenes-dioicae]|uniref:BQ5605_C005g03678 protein n=1 Tax=Microbotryum silenes-dioicae TaxID=796604 RepID=A0A2X0PD55_9BASI|nr:BQ5605_C005g03678 [Microbotryum silenes-dioicae]
MPRVQTQGMHAAFIPEIDAIVEIAPLLRVRNCTGRPVLDGKSRPEGSADDGKYRLHLHVPEWSTKLVSRYRKNNITLAEV